MSHWCLWTVVLEKTLESPLDGKENQPVHPKGNQSWVFIGRIDVEAETPILCPPDAKSWLFEKSLMLGKTEGRRRRGWQRMRLLDGITWLNEHGFGWTLRVGDGQEGLACCGLWGRKETQLSGWTELRQDAVEHILRNWSQLRAGSCQTTDNKALLRDLPWYVNYILISFPQMHTYSFNIYKPPVVVR